MGAKDKFSGRVILGVNEFFQGFAKKRANDFDMVDCLDGQGRRS